jgi:hypothetical protein
MPGWTRVAAVATLGLSLGLGACAGSGPNVSADPFSAATEGPQTISIHVTNLNFQDARLWAVSTAGRQRIGVVGGKANAVYRISWEFSRPLRFEIDLLAGPSCTTDALMVDPGDELQLQIEMDLARMRYCR